MKKADMQELIYKEAIEDIEKAIRHRGLGQEANKQFYLGRVSGMVTVVFLSGDAEFYKALRTIQDLYFD